MSSHIFPNSNYLKIFEKKRNVCWKLIQSLKRTVWVKPFCSWFLFHECLKQKKILVNLSDEALMNLSNGLNQTAFWSEFPRNFVKFNINQTICAFDKNWSNFSTQIIWLNTCIVPDSNLSKILSNSKRELLMETYIGSLKGLYFSTGC